MPKKKQNINIRELITENGIKSKGNDIAKGNDNGIKEYQKVKINNSNYSDFFAQYKDPRWQKKRLQIMERDHFICRHCQVNDKTLNVHHLIYLKDTRPWEYEDEDLITLCEDCHLDLTITTNKCIEIIRKSGRYSECLFETSEIIKMIEGLNPFQLMIIKKVVENVIRY